MHPALNDQQLAELIAQKKSAHVDFKESLHGNAPHSIREAICVFANDLPQFDRPGIVVIGLNDEGNPVGTPVTEEMLRSLTDIRSDATILPPPVLLVEKRLFRGREVAIVTVQPSDSPPVRHKGAIHVRSGPRRGIATAQKERILNERRRHGDRPFDITPIRDTSIAWYSDSELAFLSPENCCETLGIRSLNSRSFQHMSRSPSGRYQTPNRVESHDRAFWPW